MQYFNLGGGNSIRLATGTAAPAFDPDAQLFITNASITDPTQQTAINTLVVDLKTYGIWSKMKAIYPFVGGTASTHKFNLKNPVDSDAAFRLVFNGGWTHSATGAQPNGTNGYADTKFKASLNQSINSNGLGIYIKHNIATSSDPVMMGSYSSLIVVTSTVLKTRLNGTLITGSISGGDGAFDAQKTSDILTKIYKNASIVASGVSGGTFDGDNIFIGTLCLYGAPYAQGYVNSQFRFAYLSDGLNDTEIANLRTSVQAFQTTLGRQV